jgi:FMN phosphatase YigB (HAD superfamily)
MGETLNTPPLTGRDLQPLYELEEVILRKYTRETLQKVKDLGFKQSILSNTAISTSEDLVEFLKKNDIDSYFEFVYGSNSELVHDKMEKPDKEIFEHVLNNINVLPHEAVMIGNTWEKDVVGANRAGMNAIWLLNPEVSIQKEKTAMLQTPPFIFHVWDLNEIPGMLVRLRELTMKLDISNSKTRKINDKLYS